MPPASRPSQDPPSGRSKAPAPRRDSLRLVRDPHSGIDVVTAEFFGHAYDMHRHDEWLIGVTHAGVQDFFCRGRRRQSTPGRVILMEPGERHDGQAGHEHGFRYSMLYLPQGWMRDEMGGRDADIGFRQTQAEDAQLARAIARACDTVLAGEAPLAIDEARESMLGLLRGHLGRRVVPPPAADPSLAHRAMDYLQAHHDRSFGLDELAGAVGATSRFQLDRAFRREFGASPHACLVEIRLARARELLRSEVQPAEVAAASGFADQSHLGRWFRRAYGVTPAAYRFGRTNVPDRARAAR